MKKFILGITTLMCFFAMSHGFEANIKVGYDFFRGSTKYRRDISPKRFEQRQNTRGFVIGVEVLPFTFIDERLKFGAGIEYNFGETNVKYKGEDTYYGGRAYSFLTTMIPLYATAKFTYYRPKNIDLNLYTFVRLGYARATKEEKKVYFDISGIYYGLGFGIDYKYFLSEILYDGKYKFNLDSFDNEDIYSYHHKVGIRLGVQLGTQHFKKAQIESKMSEKKIEVSKVVENK